jgi:hypothetical protein
MDVYARIASTQDGGQIRVLLDGELLATINIPNTGSLTTWQTVSAACLPLPNRENATLKLEFVGTGFCLNWIQFQNQMPFLGIPFAIPGRVEFENYDLGGQQISWFDTTTGNVYGGYRTKDDVDIMAVTDNGAGFAVYDSATEWLEYTCNIEPGTYTIVIRHTSNSAAQQLTLSLGTGTLATFILPKTNGYSNWQDTTLSDIYLTGGEQVLRFKMDLSAGLLNYVDFIRQYNPADMTRTGQVNIDDFELLAAQWLSTPGVPSADIAPPGGDGVVNFLDLMVLVDNWLIVQ